jgi:hypothetical protein
MEHQTTCPRSLTGGPSLRIGEPGRRMSALIGDMINLGTRRRERFGGDRSNRDTAWRGSRRLSTALSDVATKCFLLERSHLPRDAVLLAEAAIENGSVKQVPAVRCRPGGDLHMSTIRYCDGGACR